MVKNFRLLVMNQLGFSRVEANAVLVLIVIVLAVAILPKIYLRQTGLQAKTQKINQLKNQISLQDILQPKSQPDASIGEGTKVKNFEKKFSQFDPNVTSMEDLIKLGFSKSEANRIVNYIKAGGSFKVKSDLLRIYNINTTIVNSVWEYIDLPEQLEKPKDIVISPSSSPNRSLLSINQASAIELKKIKGIGDGYAKRIISYRERLGGFYDLEQLREVYGLPDSLMSRFHELFYADIQSIKGMQINQITADSLSRHPYLNVNQARAIVSYREQHGVFMSTDDLKKIKIIPDSVVQKLSYYLSFD